MSKLSEPIWTCSPSSSQRSGVKLRTPLMPNCAPLETTLSSRNLSAWCGPTIGTFSASRNSAAPPTWSIWPWVSQIFSTFTAVFSIAAKILGTSPPGSNTTACLVSASHRMVQFCSNSVTGTMIAPAFALVSFSLLFSLLMAAQCRFLERCESERFMQQAMRNRVSSLLMEQRARQIGLVPPPDGRQSETALAVARGTARLLRSLGVSCLSELPLPSGRRADLVALNERGEIWIIEIKSSVEDLRADHKWEDYRAHCDRLYFAFTQDVPCEIFPKDTGLIVADAYGAHMLCEAPEHRLPAPTR